MMAAVCCLFNALLLWVSSLGLQIYCISNPSFSCSCVFVCVCMKLPSVLKATRYLCRLCLCEDSISSSCPEAGVRVQACVCQCRVCGLQPLVHVCVCLCSVSTCPGSGVYPLLGLAVSPCVHTHETARVQRDWGRFIPAIVPLYPF